MLMSDYCMSADDTRKGIKRTLCGLVSKLCWVLLENRGGLVYMGKICMPYAAGEGLCSACGGEEAGKKSSHLALYTSIDKCALDPQ